MKALERPQQWHEENARRLQQTRVKVYLVFEATDDDEYNRYFPYSKAGYAQARELAKRCNERVRVVEEKVEFLPIPFIRKGNEKVWEAWGL